MEPWQTIMMVGGVAVVCAAVLPRRAQSHANADSNSQSVRNMETALEQFMENIEADNREIANLVGKFNQESQAQAAKRDERIAQLERRCAELEQKLAEQALRAVYPSNPQVEPAAPEPKQAATLSQSEMKHASAFNLEVAAADEQVDAPAALSIQDRYAELFEMYRSGKSIDAIAKKLGRNKGEIQLILQLSKQEEAARHE
jgi:DNA-binding NarL/FixJ family response regulator